MMEGLFGGMAPWFTAPALLGTGYLLLQLALGHLGGDIDADLDVGSGHGMDNPGAEARWLSLETVSAFFVGFGWIGLAAHRALDMTFLSSSLAGLAAGLGVAWMVISLTRQVMKLQSSGNLDLNATVGREAPVYIAIPPADAGTGRITLVVNNTQHEVSARQSGHEAIATNTLVRIIEVDAATGTVVVERA
ncbi:MAG: hypothetical protein DYG94_04395 [Leptolyngbya sp. PLA3]|nr:MAG: hypothetical protein EDM82_07500 [Cyanobacteria bacterium CYA]MCE7967971.1 hypothetical protein [Leptolyngbya sp. PL-A3]